MTEATTTLEAANEAEPMSPKQRKILVVVSLLAVLLLGLLIYLFWPARVDNWTRPALPFATAKVHRGYNLARFSEDHGNRPPILLALANRTDLGIAYPATCGPERYDTWPRRGNGYFCNGRLNLREASTLVPDQTLRVFPNDTQTFAPTIAALPNIVPTGQRAVVLIDGRNQRNLDHGAAIAFALQQRGRLGGIWIYENSRVFEFIDTGRSLPLGRQAPGVRGALAILSVQPIDRIVLVAATVPEDLQVPEGVQPVIGYCMQREGCEPDMQELAEDTGGQYIAYAP
ncbi:MAG TPA: hypothetical protein VF696_02825 [Candidatus Paceibacterota bacterium]|jgi:hypothetical protein